MKQIFFLILFSLSIANGQNPGKEWQMVEDPSITGFDTTGLYDKYWLSESSALLVIKNGKVIFSLGEISRRFKCHSVRKSLLSCLYGVFVKDGAIDLNKNLGELGIYDRIKLNQLEKTATIKNLLTARSGVYLPAGLETQQMKDGRPKRNAHKPGLFWYYNNWDFNVLGTILKNETNQDLFEAFNEKIAKPIEMEDFRVFDGTYDYEDTTSLHPGYPFKMSARDLARIGQLYLQNGVWNGKEILSTEWIEKTTTRYTKFSSGSVNYISTGYGYLFWIIEEPGQAKSFYADGYGGQYVGIYPDDNLVIVIRGNSYINKTAHHRRSLVNAILEAQKNVEFNFAKMKPLEISTTLDKYKVNMFSGIKMMKFAGDYETEGKSFTIMLIDGNLILSNYHYYYKFKLYPISTNEFFVEDIELIMTFDFDEEGDPINPKFKTLE